MPLQCQCDIERSRLQRQREGKGIREGDVRRIKQQGVTEWKRKRISRVQGKDKRLVFMSGVKVLPKGGTFTIKVSSGWWCNHVEV